MFEPKFNNNNNIQQHPKLLTPKHLLKIHHLHHRQHQQPDAPQHLRLPIQQLILLSLTTPPRPWVIRSIVFDEGPAHRGSQDGPVYLFNHSSNNNNNNRQQQQQNTQNFRRPNPDQNYNSSYSSNNSSSRHQYGSRTPQYDRPDLGIWSGAPDRSRSTSR